MRGLPLTTVAARERRPLAMVPLTRAQLLQAEQPAAHDPADLGPYLLCNILSFLPPEELLTAALVSRGWHEAASQPGPWRAHCEVRMGATARAFLPCLPSGVTVDSSSAGPPQLLTLLLPLTPCLGTQAAWESLVYVPLAARTDLSWKQRYLAAEADLQRTAITEEELTTFRWVGGATAGGQW